MRKCFVWISNDVSYDSIHCQQGGDMPFILIKVIQNLGKRQKFSAHLGLVRDTSRLLGGLKFRLISYQYVQLPNRGGR